MRGGNEGAKHTGVVTYQNESFGSLVSLLLMIRAPGRIGEERDLSSTEGIGRGFMRGTHRETWDPGTVGVGSWGQ